MQLPKHSNFIKIQTMDNVQKNAITDNNEYYMTISCLLNRIQFKIILTTDHESLDYMTNIHEPDIQANLF
jgi:hypothetical protein